MPLEPQEGSVEKAFMNAARVMKETNCNGVKLEGGQKIKTIKHLTKSNSRHGPYRTSATVY